MTLRIAPLKVSTFNMPLLNVLQNLSESYIDSLLAQLPETQNSRERSESPSTHSNPLSPPVAGPSFTSHTTPPAKSNPSPLMNTQDSLPFNFCSPSQERARSRAPSFSDLDALDSPDRDISPQLPEGSPSLSDLVRREDMHALLISPQPPRQATPTLSLEVAKDLKRRRVSTPISGAYYTKFSLLRLTREIKMKKIRPGLARQRPTFDSSNSQISDITMHMHQPKKLDSPYAHQVTSGTEL